jgi:hypothetical protein
MPVFLGAARSRKQLQVVASEPVARELELYAERASGVGMMPEDDVHEAWLSDHGDVRAAQAQATAWTGTSGTLTPGDRIPTIGAANYLGYRTPGEIRMAVYRHWLVPSGSETRRTRMVRGRDLGDLVSPIPTALKPARSGADTVTRSISPAWTRT